VGVSAFSWKEIPIFQNIIPIQEKAVAKPSRFGRGRKPLHKMGCPTGL
jgi:hypothetical protein